MSKKLWIYGMPGPIGGADTKMDHMMPLFVEIFGKGNVFSIANAPAMYDPPNEVSKYLDSLGVKYGLKEDMKGYKDGDIALSLCNPFFFKDKFIVDAKNKGLKVIWSSEMMWHHKEELDYVKKGMVDKVLYVSEVQKAVLEPGYPGLPSTITGNYIDPDRFPFKPRAGSVFNIGRLSRNDSYKYTENFPVFYEEIVEGLPPGNILFKIMAWDDLLAQKYRWHNFTDKYAWQFLQGLQIPVLDFLYGLDVFAYPLGHNFVESWGRSTVEAMLTGVIPITYSGHHIDKLVEHGVSGFISDDVLEWREIMHELFHDPYKRAKMSKDCADHAREEHCKRETHLEIWKQALDV